jgi:hypothetical protein
VWRNGSRVKAIIVLGFPDRVYAIPCSVVAFLVFRHREQGSTEGLEGVVVLLEALRQ